MGTRINDVSSLFGNVLKIDMNATLIEEKLYDIIENTLQVDGLKIQRKTFQNIDIMKEIQIFEPREEFKINNPEQVFTTPNEKQTKNAP